MGIEGLIPFCKTKVPNCFVKTPASNLHRKRIAIDGYNWLFTYLNTVMKNIVAQQRNPLENVNMELVFKNTLREFIKFNIKFTNYKITPVWVWDGKPLPYKTVTKEKRTEQKQKIKDKKENLKRTLMDMSLLERPPEMLNQYRNLVAQTTYFPYDKIEELKKVSELIGLPTLTAEYEGEHLAASLAVNRQVACVWSADSDTYAIGAPFVMKKTEWLNRELYIEGVFTLSILYSLGLNHQEFRDFCILCGCDFGSRIPKIGPAKAYGLIKKHKCIESIRDNEGLDVSCLNHEICRKLLTPERIDESLNLNIEESDYCEELEKYNLEGEFQKFFTSVRNFPEAQNVPSF